MTNSTTSVTVWRDASILRITGTHTKEFLQGYLSSNTDNLTKQRPLPMSICNLQGRVIASGWAIELDDAVALLVHSSLLQTLRDYLRPYVAFSKCDMLTKGPSDATVLINSDGVELVNGLSVSLEPSLDTPNPAAEDGSHEATKRLGDAQFVFVSAAISARFLPQMLGLHECGAVDFNKGCYLGQEIVARAQFRGKLKRQLQAIELDAATSESVEVGQQLDDKSVVVQCAGSRALVVAPAP